MSAHIATKLLTDCQYCWLRVHRAKQQMYGDRQAPRPPSHIRRASATPAQAHRWWRASAALLEGWRGAGRGQSAPHIRAIIFGNYEYLYLGQYRSRSTDHCSCFQLIFDKIKKDPEKVHRHNFISDLELMLERRTMRRFLGRFWAQNSFNFTFLAS